VENFGADKVASLASKGVAYPSRGSLGRWCKAKFPERNYDLLYAEVGTYPIFKVVKALRAENRAYFYTQRDDPTFQWTHNQLVETFTPKDPSWREAAVSQGIDIVRRALLVFCQ
jgi:hypothetical protein